MATTLVPPYAGAAWKNYTDIYTFALVWSAHRIKPLSGEIVMQLGTQATDFQLGFMKVGFQHTFKTVAGGAAQIVVDVNPGPVTRRGVSFCTVDANLKGPGRVDKTVRENVYSYRPLSLLLEATLLGGSTYTLTFYGNMEISAYEGQSLYGEIITAFPKVTRFGAAATAVVESVAEAPEDARVSEARRSKPVLTKVSLEEAYRAGADGFEGGTEVAGSSKRRRKK